MKKPESIKASADPFYVAMTRGKCSNRAYVIDDEDSVLGDNAALGMERDWKDTLEAVLRKQSAPSAHQAAANELERVSSIRQLAAEYQTLIATQLEDEYLQLLSQLGLLDEESHGSPYLGPVLANIRRVEQLGYDPRETIEEALASRELGTARTALAVLHFRLGKFVDDHTELDYLAGEYAPMLNNFGIALTREDPVQYRSSLRLARILAALDDQRRIPVEGAVRQALESIDRQKTQNIPARLAGLLQVRHEFAVDPVATAARHRGTGRLVAGLIERAPAHPDPDFQAALEDREQAILLRAEHLVDQAIANEEPWLSELGEPIPGAQEEWRRRAATVACYRELYGVEAETALGAGVHGARNRERDRTIAQAALVPLAAAPQPGPHPKQYRQDVAQTYRWTAPVQ